MSDVFSRALKVVRDALALEGQERERFVDEACEGDVELRREVELLLELDREADPRFDESQLQARHDGLSAMAQEAAASAATPTNRAGELRPSDPRRIGSYELVRRLGQGGMGIVYEARQENPRRTVALKRLVTGSDERHLARFRLEAQVLGRLQHPAIAQIHEAGTFEALDGEEPYFAMELAPGEDLLSWSRHPRRTIEEKLETFVQICNGVHHAHMRGVVHRDLKPSNIIVDPSGAPKILDFGVARANDGDVQLTTMDTRTGHLVGTVAYMSPEQAAGDASEVTAMSDVYSLGVVLYELLSGRLPHNVHNRPIPEAVRTIQEDHPTRLSSVDTVYRGDLDTITARALEREPARRYMSAAELAADVQRFLRSEPILARPPSAVYQLTKFVRRHRGFSAGIALAALALVAGLGVALWFAIGKTRLLREAERASYAGTISNAANAWPRQLETRVYLNRTQEQLRGWEYDFLARDARSPDWRAELKGIEVDTLRIAVRLSPSGHRVATLDGPEKLVIFDARTGERLHTLVHDAGWSYRGLALTDSRVAAGTLDGLVLVFDLETGRQAERADVEHMPIDIVWVREGRELAVATASSRDVATAEYGTFVGPPNALTPCTAIGPGEALGDGPELVFLDSDMVQLVDLATRRFDPTPFPPSLTIHRAAGSPAGEFLGNGTSGTLGTWRRTGDRRFVQQRPLGPLNRPWSMAYGPRDRLSVLSYPYGNNAYGGQVRVEERPDVYTDRATVYLGLLHCWDQTTSRLKLQIPFRAPGDCAVDDAGRLFALREYDAVNVWDLSVGSIEGDLELEHPEFVYDVLFSPDGRTLITYGYHQNVRLWDVLDGRLLGTFHRGGENGLTRAPTEPLAVSADGTRLLVGGQEGFLWESDLGFETAFRKRERLWNPPVFDDPLDKVQLRPPARPWFALAGDPIGARLLERSPTGDLIRERDGVYDADSNRLLWRFRDEYEDLDVAVKGNSTGQFSPDGRTLAYCDDDQTGVFDARTGALIADLRQEVPDRCYDLAFHPDGSRVAAGLIDGTIAIWETKTYTLVLRLKIHEQYIRALAWSPDGTALATASGDKTARILHTSPADERVALSRKAARLRAELRPRVEGLLNQLADPAGAARELREDGGLSPDERHAALAVLRELATTED